MDTKSFVENYEKTVKDYHNKLASYHNLIGKTLGWDSGEIYVCSDYMTALLNPTCHYPEDLIEAIQYLEQVTGVFFKEVFDNV